MTHTLTLPSSAITNGLGLAGWMNRVLDIADQVDDDWDAKKVHDLRVALRRCRTMAEALSEVNPAPGWKKLKKSTRDLFQALGDLRDTQVEQEWVKKLGAAGDPVRKHLLNVLTRQEKTQQKDAEKALGNFDRKDWKKLSRKLPPKAEFFPVESVVFQRLALARLNKAVELHQHARKGRSRVAWHRLRIGLKDFRYILENFLPQRYKAWSEDLKRLQDLLGEVHDLDVLRTVIRKHCSKLDTMTVTKWHEKIDDERKARLDEIRAKTSDKESVWLVWRAGFQLGHTLQIAAFPESRSA